MTDCKILQLATEIEELEFECRMFIASVLNNDDLTIKASVETMKAFANVHEMVFKILKIIKAEEAEIINITNLNESTANSGVDINI